MRPRCQPSQRWKQKTLKDLISLISLTNGDVLVQHKCSQIGIAVIYNEKHVVFQSRAKAR